MLTLTVALPATLAVAFPDILEWPWPVRILISLSFGVLTALVGEHVRNVAQIALDLEADRKAMRDAIDWLERGG